MAPCEWMDGWMKVFVSTGKQKNKKQKTPVRSKGSPVLTLWLFLCVVHHAGVQHTKAHVTLLWKGHKADKGTELCQASVFIWLWLSPRESTENSTSAEQWSHSYWGFSEDLSHLPLDFPTTGPCLQEKHSFVAYFLILSHLILTVKTSNMQVAYQNTVEPWQVHPDMLRHFGICCEISQPTELEVIYVFARGWNKSRVMSNLS